MMQGSLARTLRVLRAERGWTLREASSRVGVTKETLSDLERGLRHPHDPTLAKIAKGYGVSFEELLVEEGELAAPLGEASESGPPLVSKERLQEHFEDVRQDEVDYLNGIIADFWRLAQPGEKPVAHVVPDEIDTDRVWGFLQHAFEQRNVFTPEEAERINRGARKKALAGS